MKSKILYFSFITVKKLTYHAIYTLTCISIKFNLLKNSLIIYTIYFIYFLHVLIFILNIAYHIRKNCPNFYSKAYNMMLTYLISQTITEIIFNDRYWLYFDIALRFYKFNQFFYLLLLLMHLL